MRGFIASHPKYNKDSVINQEVAFDLMSVSYWFDPEALVRQLYPMLLAGVS